MRLIGLTGYAGSGKTTAARVFEEFGFVRLSFAAPIKAMLAQIIPDEYLHDRKETVMPWLGCSARRLMQTLGTEWGRQMISPDIWVNALFNSPEFLRAKAARRGVVIDDVRFPNEVVAIKHRLGDVWRIMRDDCERAGHESEQQITLLRADVGITNNYSKARFASWVAEMIIHARLASRGDRIPLHARMEGSHEGTKARREEGETIQSPEYIDCVSRRDGSVIGRRYFGNTQLGEPFTP